MPPVDDKVLTDWNGMMIAAMARAGTLLDEPAYVNAAVSAAQFVLTRMRSEDGRLLHTWRQGEAKIAAFLDDYAHLMRGLLTLDEATGSELWIGEAERLAQELEDRLRDPKGGYYLSRAQSDLLFQPKTVGEGAVPSGNAVAILDLLRLAERTGKTVYRDRAEAALRAFAEDHEGARLAPTLALAIDRYHSAPRSVAATAEGSIDRLAWDIVSGEVELRGDPGPDGWWPFALRLAIRDGWHIHAHPASLPYLVPTRIDGRARNLQYPEGRIFQFDFAAEKLAVYSGVISIPGEVREDERSLRLSYQACDDRRCLPPVEKMIELSDGDKDAGERPR